MVSQWVPNELLNTMYLQSSSLVVVLPKAWSLATHIHMYWHKPIMALLVMPQNWVNINSAIGLLIVWWHQAISSMSTSHLMKFFGIPLRSISEGIFKKSIIYTVF